MDIKITEQTNPNSKKVVGTQITIEMFEKLKKESENEFMSISDLLRKILFLYFKNKEKNEKENLK